MATLTIKNMPDALYQDLKQQALMIIVGTDILIYLYIQGVRFNNSNTNLDSSLRLHQPQQQLLQHSRAQV